MVVWSSSPLKMAERSALGATPFTIAKHTSALVTTAAPLIAYQPPSIVSSTCRRYECVPTAVATDSPRIETSQGRQQEPPRRAEIFTNTKESRNEAPPETQFTKGESKSNNNNNNKDFRPTGGRGGIASITTNHEVKNKDLFERRER
jgi:hypothetical protein